MTAYEKQRIKRMLDDMDRSRRDRIRAKLKSFFNWLVDVAGFIIKELSKAALRHLVDTFLDFS